jgi:hypothetical protein
MAKHFLGDAGKGEHVRNLVNGLHMPQTVLQSIAVALEGLLPKRKRWHFAGSCQVAQGEVPGYSPTQQTTRNKRFFASFFSKKEDSSFSEEKEAKRLLFLCGVISLASPGQPPRPFPRQFPAKAVNQTKLHSHFPLS